ncbi:MAG: uroporphyrinogen decarboxylase, partial [Gammaproteobacteria bacterium]|nr:uroporphyrinogen decarboxylase [Gammaproteobacteria bacterium]
AYGNHPGHVFNLGHGISQFTDPDKVSVLVDAVHSQSRAIRA